MCGSDHSLPGCPGWNSGAIPICWRFSHTRLAIDAGRGRSIGCLCFSQRRKTSSFSRIASNPRSAAPGTQLALWASTGGARGAKGDKVAVTSFVRSAGMGSVPCVSRPVFLMGSTSPWSLAQNPLNQLGLSTATGLRCHVGRTFYSPPRSNLLHLTAFVLFGIRFVLPYLIHGGLRFVSLTSQRSAKRRGTWIIIQIPSSPQSRTA